MTGRIFFIFCVGTMVLIVGGCAAYQASQNTIEMAATISRIREIQVLRNISSAINNRSTVPAHIVLGTGQANVTAGLGVGNGVKATNLNRAGTAFELDISPSDTWTTQWQFTSITDQDDLRRLRNVYALVVATDPQFDELVEYFKETKSKEKSSGAVFRNLFQNLLPEGESGPSNQPGPVQKPSTQTSPRSAGGQSHVISWPDAKGFMEYGDSIDCRLYQRDFQAKRATEPNPKGLPFRRWLYWRNGDGSQWSPFQPADERVTSLGVYEGREIGVTSMACFYDFVILVQGLTPTASGVSNKGPGYMLQ